MSDLIQYLESEFGVAIGDTILAHLLWADDLVLISDTLYGLKKQLGGLKKFCDNNRMLVNELKKKNVLGFQAIPKCSLNPKFEVSTTKNVAYSA